MIYTYTLRNEGSLAVLKEPLGFFCETRGSFLRRGVLLNQEGFLGVPDRPGGFFGVIAL